jgi:hypothetical protein
MTRALSAHVPLVALLIVIAVTADIPVHAARDKHATGMVTIQPDGSAVLMLDTRLGPQGKSFVYAEFEEVSLEEALAFLAPNVLAEDPGPATQFGLGVGFVATASGEIRTGNVLVRIEADGQMQVDFHWTESVTLADGTVIDDTAPFPPQFPPATSLGFKLDSSGVIDGTNNTNFFKKIIEP